MKLAPRGGMMTSLVEVNGRTVAAGWEGGAAAALIALETSAVADSANAGIPARAKDAVAAPFNKLRREILSMIEYLLTVRVNKHSTGDVITQVGAEAYHPIGCPTIIPFYTDTFNHFRRERLPQTSARSSALTCMSSAPSGI